MKQKLTMGSAVAIGVGVGTAMSVALDDYGVGAGICAAIFIIFTAMRRGGVAQE